MWGTVLGFLGKVSIKQYVYMALAGLALTLGLKMWNGYQSHMAEFNNLKEANTELTVQNNVLVNSKEQDQIVIDSLQVALTTQAEAIKVVNEQFGAARQEAERQKRVLEGTRLGRLAADRAARIESLSNAGTEERRAAMQEIINEDL